MDGVHDMGGMHNFGPIPIEHDEPVFHSDWEARVWAINMVLGPFRRWNLDMKRQATESMDPRRYLAAPYYERWLDAITRLVIEHGFVTVEEVAAGKPRAPENEEDDSLSPVTADVMLALIARGNSARDSAEVAPRFKPGDPVRARNIHPPRHTRLPRYARGKKGIIERDYGVFVFPDTHARDWERTPQHVYAVRFTAQELWGDGTAPKDMVYIDMWDDYLDPAA